MEYVYGALLLHKLGKQIDEAGLKKVISATGAEVDEAKLKVLVASLQGVNIDEQLANASVAAPAASSGGEKKAEAKAEKEEEKASESAEGLSALFG